MTTAGVPGVPDAPSTWSQHWGLRMQSTLNAVVGKTNNVADLTLAAGATSTTMVDARLSAFSSLSFTPTTAHAATALGTIFVTNQKNGQATINHASTADTDKTFKVAIHG
jgi:hypothetical protein